MSASGPHSVIRRCRLDVRFARKRTVLARPNLPTPTVTLARPRDRSCDWAIATVMNDENHGAWYAGFDDRTSLTEVAFHKTRELGYIDYYYDDVQYRALHASFIGRFHDIRKIDPIPDCLHSDTAIGYPRGQALANELIAAGSRGLIYPSVRHLGGICIVAFRPNAVQDVAPGACWRIVWNGSPQWAATAV
jgi:RES domain